MSYELITDDEYNALPEEDDQKFAALEAICRRSMNGLIEVEHQVTSGFVDAVQLQYMTTVAAAAEELRIEGLSYPNPDASNMQLQYAEFQLRASGLTTRIKLRSSKSLKPYTVRLGVKTRGRIEQQIQKLREVIDAENISEANRKSLLRKLDELSLELSEPRVSLAKVMTVLAYVSATVASGTTFLAEAPHAIMTIASLLGSDKLAEEAEALRLGPPKSHYLPAPSKSQSRLPPPKSSISAIDDDIPF